ncbi:MAG: DUF4388 domain-containing protein [Vicinamibacteria bacterium]
MALRGTLKDFALPDIFQLIGMQRKTGMLTLESERETVIVLFEGGSVVHADSTVRRLDDLLGNVLVRQNKIRKEDLEQALARQKVSMQRLGYVLTNQGFIESKDLREALSEQVQQIVFRIFRWRDGSYNFDPSKEVDYDRENVIPVTADHILMEGIRRVDEWPIIEKRIPSLEMSFRQLIPKDKIRVRQGESEDKSGLESALGRLGGDSSPTEPPNPSGEVVLSELEAKIYRLVDPKNSIQVIVDMTGMSDFDVCRILLDFLDRNLIAPAEQRAPMERAPLEAATEAEAHVTNRKGTLVLVVVVLMILAGLVLSGLAPFRVPGRAAVLDVAGQDLKRGGSLARLQKLDFALRAFFLTYGARPDSLDVLVRERLVAAEDLRDAYGVPFVYDRRADGVTLFAVSETGEPYLTYVQELQPLSVDPLPE